MDRDWEAAIRDGSVERARSALNAGADINSKDRYGNTALMLAAVNGHAAIVRLLIERGADLDICAKYNLSALMLAVINGHADAVRTLVSAGADLSIRGRGAPGFYQKTALDLAEHSGRSDIVGILRAGRTKE